MYPRIVAFLAKYGAVLALVIGLFWAGAWFRGVLAENAALTAQNDALTAQIALTESQAQAAEKAAQRASAQARDALRKLHEANDPESLDWRNQRLPPAVADSLR